MSGSMRLTGDAARRHIEGLRRDMAKNTRREGVVKRTDVERLVNGIKSAALVRVEEDDKTWWEVSWTFGYATGVFRRENRAEAEDYYRVKVLTVEAA